MTANEENAAAIVRESAAALNIAIEYAAKLKLRIDLRLFEPMWHAGGDPRVSVEVYRKA